MLTRVPLRVCFFVSESVYVCVTKRSCRAKKKERFFVCKTHGTK